MGKYLQDAVAGKSVQVDHVLEQPRQIAVHTEVDVLVCGGGPAGVGAALAAAREGAKVLLLERFGMLGGMWTAGLVNPFFCCDGKGYVVQDLRQRLEEAGAWQRWRYTHTFNAETMRLTLEEMMRECGAEFRYFTLVADAVVQDGCIRGVIAESKAGREAILAKVVVDATGDGDVAARCGCRYELGREADGRVQPVTLMFEITGAENYGQQRSVELYDALAEVLDEKERQAIMPYGRAVYAPWIIATPGGLGAVQATHIYNVNPLDPADLTRGMVEGRQLMSRFLKAMRKIPALRDVRVTQSAAALGIREGRRILGRNRSVLGHALEGARFPDGIVLSQFGLDVHDPAPEGGLVRELITPKSFEIPYGCLLPADVDGLLLAGRCISGDHMAHSSYRVTGTVMGIGQAAGLAAAAAVQSGILPSALDGQTLRAALLNRGVQFS